MTALDVARPPLPERHDGNWIQTFTGRAFWPLNPILDDIVPDDIAHSLSMLCRYGGATRRFYSVAEHCVLMSWVVPAEDALWALLHDAAEAYMVDVPRPIKHEMPDYIAAEDRLLAGICERFGLAVEQPASVRDADRRILLDERAVLLAPPRRSWGAVEDLLPVGVKIRGWSPWDAESVYLRRLAELTQ